MALRPVSFSIPSTTELKITFSENLSSALSTANFTVESLNGAVDDLEIIGLTIDNSIVTLKTRPQVAGSYYLLKFLDTTDLDFISSKGNRLLSDDVSRELFFVGIDNINPIRDRMYANVPSIFEIQNTTIGEIISAQAEEIYTAQKNIGEALSNNYIYEEVIDEPRTRTSGAVDRLANENAFEIFRVARKQTGDSPKLATIIYTEDNTNPRSQTLSQYPTSLQQIEVLDENIDTGTENNSFDGFLLSLKNKNVIKLLSVKLIKSDDVEDCDGNIGTDYNVERYKYSIKDNFYDQDYAFKFSALETNQILLSEFGNIDRPELLDTIQVSYLYKGLGRFVLESDVEVSRIESISNESIPSNAATFFLKNAPIVNADNEIYDYGGVTFKETENSTDTPFQFQRELTFNSSKLPSKLGEYSINYETGEVFVVGETTIGEGTGRNNYVADYLYRHQFIAGLDYSIHNQNLVPMPNRELSGEQVEIFIRYDEAFTEGVDYKNSCHIEVMPEFVENKLKSSFVIETENAPITNVYRIFNQTTGEVYTPLFHTNTEITFSGNRSPEIKQAISEESKFLKISNENLSIVGEFIVPAFYVTISSNESTNSIIFDPGIPAELIDINSSDYYFRSTTTGEDEVEVDDILIRFFGDADSDNLITSAGIGLTSTLPTVNKEYIVGTRAFIINLEEEGILNKNEDALGSITNSSIEFENQSVFISEKYFESVQSHNSFESTSDGNISVAFITNKTEIFSENISRLRKIGDYAVDYRYGIVYVAISKDQDVSVNSISYTCNSHVASNKNILNVSGSAKKINAPTSIVDAEIIYEQISNDNEIIKINDLENTIIIYDGETTALDLNSERQLICEVLEDYLVVVPYDIISINSLVKLSNLTGADLKSSNQDNRIIDHSASDLTTTVRNGGVNLYDSDIISYQNNVIDLKTVVSKRISLNSDGDFAIEIVDPYAETFISATVVATELELFDEELNLTKLDGLTIVDTLLSGNSVLVSLASGISLEDIDSSNDYLLDSDGNRFEITSVDDDNSTVTVISPADNNADITEPVLGAASVVIKPTVDISNGVMTITISYDSGLILGDFLEITYLTSLIPEIGTSLAIDYRYGFIFNDYNYVKDDLVVWYEYGDNSLDWSISGALEEGEGYYVSYRYGASRDALRTNFGTLTNIPFFKNFSLNTNRELYRDGLRGALQSFSKGPTIPAFENLAQTFSKTKPEIDELVFGNWILGRDNLHPGKISYEGNLHFAEGKFSEGLIFNDDVSVSIPAISALSLSEGTLEAWVRPDWAGISNDATLTFDLDNIGEEKIIIKENSNPFDYENGWEMIPVSNLIGGSDSTGVGISIFNFKSDTDEEYELDVGSFGLYKELDNLNQIIKTDFTSTMNVELFGNNFNNLRKESDISTTSLDSNINIGSFIIPDGERASGFSFNISTVADFSFTVDDTASAENSIELIEYDRLHATKSCLCEISSSYETLEQFNDITIDITLDQEFSLINFKEQYNIINDTPEVFIVIDDAGVFYQVVAFNDGDSLITNEIPNSISKIVVKKFGINNTSLSSQGSEQINLSLPSGSIQLYFKNVQFLTKSNYGNSIEAFLFNKTAVVNWTDKNNYRVERLPLENIINCSINNEVSTLFYTDSAYCSELEMDLTIDSSNLKGIIIGALNSSILSTIYLQKFKGSLFNRFSLNDIHIGVNNAHPRAIPFSVSKNDYINSTIGIPNDADTAEGIYIWFDDLCHSPLSDTVGQWIFRTRAARTIEYPTDVAVSGPGTYANIFSSLISNHKFSGTVTTDGEFSSVDRASRDEVTGNCARGDICSNSFRYCGNKLIEEYGWAKLDETSSDVINLILGGTETQQAPWKKHGIFNTSVSRGIYRMGPSRNESSCTEEDAFLGNLVFAANPCPGGNFEYLSSVKVTQIGTSVEGGSTGTFSGAVSGNITGIVPININDETVNIKIALAIRNDGQSLILVLDGETGSVLDLINYEWNDQEFHEYKIIKTKSTGNISIFIDELLASQLSTSDFQTPEFSEDAPFPEPYVAVYLMDSALIDPETYLDENIANIIDIDLVFFSGSNSVGDGYLEEATDILISTDSKIEFEFNIDQLDGYVDGYEDGYTSIVGVDEMFISSDKLRYLVDSGEGETLNRLSIFKDGKGFLNLQIYDDGLTRNKESGLFNLATNIKHFEAGELHHIAASWKLNTIDEKDELHLFIDGQEAPNIYKFGGKIPVKINDKFSDSSKEVLHNFLTHNIDFCDNYTDGTVSAGNSIFQSNSVGFTQSMIGRSLMIQSSVLAPTLVGKEFIIISVISSTQVTLGRGADFDLIEFDTSTTDISFSFPPTAGITTNVLSDLRNSKFSIYKTNSSGETEELGGILYTIDDGEINIYRGDNVISPQFRANVDSRVIEFIGENSDCEYLETIDHTDLDVHIKTFGLNAERCNQKIELSSSSYQGSESIFSGQSVIRSRNAEPISLDDVDIKRIVLDRELVLISDPELLDSGLYQVDFSVEVDNEKGEHNLTSESGNLTKQNLGRYLTLVFESDNVKFCDFDGYADGYQDGYLDGQDNTITIYGTTIDGVNEETFFINHSGEFAGEKLFTSFDRIEGRIIIADPDYFELGTISVKESDNIFTQNNGGDYCEIDDYVNGHLILTVVGSSGTTPFELHPGYYTLDYPAFLTINLPNLGDKLFIGSDFNSRQQFGGVIDEFRIISEMSSDTRTTELDTSGTRSVTNDYNKSVPFCPDSQTFTLIPFNNPIDLQRRRLRNTIFLDKINNVKYKLNNNQQEKLLSVVNNSTEFISQMINYGFNITDATKTFFEVSKAEGGPIFNEAEYYQNFVEFPQSENSVNDSFGNSANFVEGSGIIIKNDAGQFRRNEGTIEFWVSPLIDTAIDNEARYYVDIYSVNRARVLSKSSTVIELPTPTNKIIDIKLIQNTQEFSSYFTTDEVDQILFDEISRSDITGRLTGGTGTQKNFSINSKLSADGNKIFLSEGLPAANTDVIVTYVPLDSSGDRFSIFKNESSQIVFGITAEGIDNVVLADIDWKKNTWHRIMCTYKTNSGFDVMRIFVDGVEGSYIRYGTGLLYGSNLVFNQFIQGEGQARGLEFNIELQDEFKLIAIGSDIFGDKSARGRMDNLRFSRVIRDAVRDSAGSFIDINFSENSNTNHPVVEDDATTLMMDFDASLEKIDKFATIIDSKNGIFNFDITIMDNFDRIIGVEDGLVEDLIVELVNRLKPAHANALVKFVKNRC